MYEDCVLVDVLYICSVAWVDRRENVILRLGIDHLATVPNTQQQLGSYARSPLTRVIDAAARRKNKRLVQVEKKSLRCFDIDMCFIYDGGSEPQASG